VLPRTSLPKPVHAELLEFMRTSRREVWNITEDSSGTLAHCLVCSRRVAAEAKKKVRARNSAFQRGMYVNLNGKAALWRIKEHETSQLHVAAVSDARFRQILVPIPRTVHDDEYFRCNGIDLAEPNANGLSAYQVGGCLGMCGVSTFSRRL
jgi:hypothetical protein